MDRKDAEPDTIAVSAPTLLPRSSSGSSCGGAARLPHLRHGLRCGPPAFDPPAYDIEGLTKGFLALISVGITAALLLLLPRILVLPTRNQLQQAYAALEEEIKQRSNARPWSNVFMR